MIAVPLIVVLELFSQGRAPIDSGLPGEANSAKECKVCHEAEYLEWRGSRHSRAWTNDFFQYDYKSNRAQWCRNCHIPLEAQQADGEVALALRDEGVNCVVCHLREGKMHARTKRKNSPHDTVESEAFGSDSFCEGCHQFKFPILGEGGALVAYTQHPMQSTVEQYRKGPFAESKTCRDCHAATPGKHFYAGSHDLGMLRRALDFEVCRSGKKLRTRLTNVGAGHNVPTGDVHRHVLIKAWRSNAPEKFKEAFYGRRFQPLVSGGKATIWDSTLPPNSYRDWRFDPAVLGGTESDPVNLEVRYLYGSREDYKDFSEPAYQTLVRMTATIDGLDECE